MRNPSVSCHAQVPHASNPKPCQHRVVQRRPTDININAQLQQLLHLTIVPLEHGFHAVRRYPQSRRFCLQPRQQFLRITWGTGNIRINHVLIRVQRCGHGGSFQISFWVGYDVLALPAQAFDTQFNHITGAQVLLRFLPHSNAGRSTGGNNVAGVKAH